MTIPVPLGTDPSADAALHIRNFADAVDAKLTSPLAVKTFDTGSKQTDSNGVISAAAVTSLATISGAVMIGCYQTDNLFTRPTVARDTNAGNIPRFKVFNAATGGRYANSLQRVVGLVWGPPAAAALDETIEPAAAVPPGTLFPPGTTSKGLRYPGTDGPQWGVADAISDLADDIGKAIGGPPAGLNLATWTGSLTVTDSAGTIARYFTELKRIRGAVVTAWDTSGDYRQSRIFTWYRVEDYWSPEAMNRASFICSTNEKNSEANPYPKALAQGAAVGVNILAWGDV